jgi:hypothetical protein
MNTTTKKTYGNMEISGIVGALVDALVNDPQFGYAGTTGYLSTVVKTILANRDIPTEQVLDLMIETTATLDVKP